MSTGRVRWRRPASGELTAIMRRLESWPCDVGGRLRHTYPLACLESSGVEVARVAEDGDRWALTLVHPGRILVPCGDPSVIAEAGLVSRRWKMLFGDEAASDACLAQHPVIAGTVAHEQRFYLADEERVPSESAVADPGLRRAERPDLDALASLAVQLHLDDEFPGTPGRLGWRGYRERLAASVTRGLVWVVGPPGRPYAKVERSVSSPRYGVQLAGIVVEPAARGSGLGTAAVAAAIRGALREFGPTSAVTLSVRAANEVARRAYAAAGMVDREAWRLVVRP